MAWLMLSNGGAWHDCRFETMLHNRDVFSDALLPYAGLQLAKAGPLMSKGVTDRSIADDANFSSARSSQGERAVKDDQ
jgi:hypothetical protein